MDMFNPEFYAMMHPEYLQRSGLAILDYVRHGWKEGANPGPHFNTAWYLETYQDSMPAGMSPLEHFARFGKGSATMPVICEWAEMSQIQQAHLSEIVLYLATRAGLFNERFYKQTYPDLTSELSGLDHYRRNGWKEMRVPSLLFSQCMDNQPLTNPLVALLTDTLDNLKLAILLAGDELRRKCLSQKLFDQDYYAFTYADVAQNSPDCFLHYMLLGWRLGYNPSPSFNTAWYQERHPNLKGNPLYNWFYAEGGRGESFPAVRDFPLLPAHVRVHALDICAWEVAKRGWFDAEFYSCMYPDVSEAEVPAWVHYCKNGIKENRLPSLKFHSDWYLNEYLNSNPQDCALWHYLTEGEKRGDSAIPNDQIQILKEENALLFEQVNILQKELLAIKNGCMNTEDTDVTLGKSRKRIKRYRPKLKIFKDNII